MRWIVTCALLLAIALSPLNAARAAAGGADCPKAVKQLLGHCPRIDKNDTFVDISGRQTKPGHRAAPVHHAGGNGTSTRPAPHPLHPKPKPNPNPKGQCDWNWALPIPCTTPTTKSNTPTPPPPATPGIPPITITDLASFAPQPATLTGEPDNLGVAGLPTNFTSTATTHTRTGELFGFPVTARFTPTTFTFHYGDGATKTTTTPGTSWQALALPQFTPTDTSHTYTHRGIYTATSDTTYTAQIDLGTGYFPIPGTLTIPGTPQTIHIYEAHTALVAHTCNEDPTATGC